MDRNCLVDFNPIHIDRVPFLSRFAEAWLRLVRYCLMSCYLIRYSLQVTACAGHSTSCALGCFIFLAESARLLGLPGHASVSLLQLPVRVGLLGSFLTNLLVEYS